MLSAQKQINEMLQLSPSHERTQLMLELQTLREKNQNLKAEVQELKTKKMQEQETPKPVQEKKDLDEMDQPLPDQAPSPLKDPQELFEDQPVEQHANSVWRTLMERLQ